MEEKKTQKDAQLESLGAEEQTTESAIPPDEPADLIIDTEIRVEK